MLRHGVHSGPGWKKLCVAIASAERSQINSKILAIIERNLSIKDSFELFAIQRML